MDNIYATSRQWTICGGDTHSHGENALATNRGNSFESNKTNKQPFSVFLRMRLTSKPEFKLRMIQGGWRRRRSSYIHICTDVWQYGKFKILFGKQKFVLLLSLTKKNKQTGFKSRLEPLTQSKTNILYPRHRRRIEK